MLYTTVFLDRDGVINRMRGDYVKVWEEFELLPGAIEAIARIARSGRNVIVVTNQSAIAQNLVTANQVDKIHRRFSRLVAHQGGQIRGFLVCPHGSADLCSCRKPAPGLFWRARDELGVELPDAVMVGDQFSDVLAAHAAGCDAILVDPGATARSVPEATNYVVVNNLVEAAELICGN